MQQKGGYMEKYIDILGETELFKDIAKEDIGAILSCLSAQLREYGEGQVIYSEGERIENVAIILKGRVELIRENYDGNINIISKLEKGDIFGESFAFGKIESLPISVYSEGESQILFINYKKIVNTCSTACEFHNSLIFNMLHILARKNIGLNEKNLFLGEKTIRKKLLSYLASQARKRGKKEFHIGFDRQGLADYLSVNRSAMSRELSKMQDQGLIEYRGNYFKIN